MDAHPQRFVRSGRRRRRHRRPRPQLPALLSDHLSRDPITTKPIRLVPGEWTPDQSFDGVTNTRPDGVIYLVTGAGGAGLYNPEQQTDPSSWLDFTLKFHSQTHSFTVADIDGRTARFRQLSDSGDLIDSFTITK